MRYDNICEGIFRSRPNRFTANVEIGGRIETVHVCNTGRCAELLQDGNTVYLVHRSGANRKTAYDLTAVCRRDGKLINMDSMAPNSAAFEWISAGNLGDIACLKREVTVGDSRYDIVGVQGDTPVLIEVKGCTLERDSVAYFPDAPTGRGAKHVRGLALHRAEGMRCILLIVIQMEAVSVFRPNKDTDPGFYTAVKEARMQGVEVIAVNCDVQPGYVAIKDRIPVEI